jgi:hypothetical protein
MYVVIFEICFLSEIDREVKRNLSLQQRLIPLIICFAINVYPLILKIKIPKRPNTL